MKFQIKELLSRIGANKEKGQTLIEYALLVLLIAIVVIAVLILLGPQIATVFNNIRTQLSTV
jgi:pilus assembly protein Flp/PilA